MTLAACSLHGAQLSFPLKAHSAARFGYFDCPVAAKRRSSKAMATVRGMNLSSLAAFFWCRGPCQPGVTVRWTGSLFPGFSSWPTKRQTSALFRPARGTREPVWCGKVPQL